jgi:hypothetical protein
LRHPIFYQPADKSNIAAGNVDTKTAFLLRNGVIARQERSACQLKAADQTFGQGTGFGQFEDAFAEVTAVQLCTKQFAEKDKRDALALPCPADKRDGVAAVIFELETCFVLAGEFANAGTPAVLTGHAEYDVAANELGRDALKGGQTG